MAALKLWEKAFDKSVTYEFGFATSVAIEPDGKYPLGTSGSGHIQEYETSTNYHPEKYLKFLDDSVSRLHRLRAVGEDKSLTPQQRAVKIRELQAEIIESLQEANKNTKSQRK